MGRLKPQSCVCPHKAVWLQPEWCLSFLVLRKDCVVPRQLEDGGAGVTEWLCSRAPFMRVLLWQYARAWQPRGEERVKGQ